MREQWGVFGNLGLHAPLELPSLKNPILQCCWLMVQSLGLEVEGLGFGVWVQCFRAQVSKNLKVQGLKFMFLGLRRSKRGVNQTRQEPLKPKLEPETPNLKAPNYSTLNNPPTLLLFTPQLNPSTLPFPGPQKPCKPSTAVGNYQPQAGLYYLELHCFL